MDYQYLQDWTDKLFGEPPPLPFNARRRVKREGQPEPLALTEANIDEPDPAELAASKKRATKASRGVRCELCEKLLKYGTRPSTNLETDKPGYICSSCRADHQVWFLPPGGDGDSHFEQLPKKTKCDSVILYVGDTKVVKDVILGCGAESSPWERRANGYVRFTIHKDNCQIAKRFKHAE